MKVYYISLPKKKQILKYISQFCKFGVVGLQIMFFLGLPKGLIMGAAAVNSIVGTLAEQLGKS